MTIREILDSNFFRPRNLVAAGVAVALALVTWFGVGSLLTNREPPPSPAPAREIAQPPAPVEAEPAPVYPKLLVAKRDIKSGVMLVSDLVEWREWQYPIDLNLAVLQDTIPLQAVLGSVTRQSYAHGSPIAWDGIITPGGPGFVGAVLKPGMRAVTIEVDRATTSANIIFPGDRVDVIMVMTGEAGVSQAIVRDVRVLAVGSTIFSLGRYGRVSLSKAGAIEPVAPPAGDNYTLELLPVDAERIALAVTAGRLTLAMRSVADAPAYELDVPHAVRLSEVIVEPPPPPPSVPAVRIIRGTASSELAAADL